MAADRIRIAHSLKSLGSPLILLLLFASSAHAVEIDINPGAVGELVDQTLTFPVPFPGAMVVDLRFTDQKTLEWDQELLTFAIKRVPAGFPVPLPVGFLTDEMGKIEGTDFDGSIDGGIINVQLSPPVVWTGMHFESAFQGVQDQVAYSVVWTSRPTVGMLPEPGATGCGVAALATLAALARRRRVE